MIQWLRKKSLVASCSLALSVLMIAAVSIVATLMYQSTKDEVFRKFSHVGNKLRDVAQADIHMISVTAAAMAEGKEPPQDEMAIMKRLLSGTTDDYLVANAYYLLPEYRQEGDNKYFRYLQASQSLESMDIVAGSEYENHGSFSQVYEQALKGEAGLTEVFADEYGEWLTYLSPLKDDSGKVVAVYGADYDYHSVSERLSALVWTAILISAAAIALSALLIFLLLRQALRPLQVMAARAKEAAEGDLTVSVPVTSTNEVGRASSSFNEMVANLRQLAIQINRTSSEVSNSSGHLKETAGQTEAATNEIAQAISQVAVGADTQLASSGECQRAMSEMAAGIQRIAESTAVVSDLAADTANLATDGADVIQQTVRQMGLIEDHVGNAARDMQELNHSSERIGSILAHIAEVANQTNLLALNASIEASRAGEHGKGFAVVAHEIRKLAERSKQSSEEISDVLHEIGERSQAVTKSLNISAEQVREGTKLANASGESFQAIHHAVRQVSGQVEEVSSAAEQMSAGSEEVAASLEQLERTAQVSASNAQEVAAASEEQLASVEEVASASQQLSTLASQLNEAVTRFKV